MQTQRRNAPASSEAGEVENNKKTAVRNIERDPIISELRKLYEGIVDEPVPDHLVELLRKLDEVERKR